MPQDFTSQELSAGGNTFTSGYTSGTVCPRTGTYKAENQYMQTIVVVVQGNKFPNFTDGKKCIWYALSANTTSVDSGFESAKVAPGTA
jgi:hypothetical protein